MRNFYLLTLLLFSAFTSWAQTTGFSGTGANIDVDNYQIRWRINPDSSVGIKGIVKIKFKTKAANVTAVSFDLRSVLVIDNVTWAGISQTVTRTGNTFSIPVNIPVAGTRDSVTITYHGAPPAASGAMAGYNYDNSTTAGGNYVNTLSESYEDRDWWPCKADMQDKADTIDITVNVPYRTNNATPASATDTFWVASNGTLVDSTIDVSGTQSQRNRTFKYINRYPMASYLVCVGVARYKRFYQGTISIGGFNVPVVYYLFANRTASAFTTITTAMDKATECLTLFSQKFGNYGFTDPAKGGKHGFYEGLTPGGGMEHQTFSAIGTGSISGKNVLIHELMHQWFGDKVSFSTWNDLWLAEAFAEYSPALARETITGLGSTAYSYRNSLRTSARSEAAPVWIPNSGIVNSNTIWTGGTGTTGYGSTVYDRGAIVVSMLRTLAGDTKFFSVMKEYQTRPTLQFRSASLDTITKIFTDSLGINMAPFFTDNVVGTGYSTNKIGYQIFGTGNKKLALSVMSQTRTNAGTASYITGPVVIHVKGASLPANDTTIVFYDWGGGQLSKAGNGVGAAVPGNALTYQLSFAPASVVYDDSARIMSGGSLASAVIVSGKITSFSAKQHTGFNDATLLLDDEAVDNPEVILERSADSLHFTGLGSMTLQAATGTTKKFLFNDMSPFKNDNYYRAYYKNADGLDIYSTIVKIGSATTLTGDFAILNNPVTQDFLQVRTADAFGKEISFRIYDGAAKLIWSSRVANAGTVTDIKLPKPAAGIYIMKITVAGEETKNIRFIVR